MATNLYKKINAIPKWTLVIAGLVIIMMFVYFVGGGMQSEIDYNTQVKPILNKRCISCHGGVKQSGGFNMITRAGFLQKNDSDKPAIVLGHPEKSELIRRITTEDLEDRMPSEGNRLPQKEIDILQQWIKEGAKWGLHWAYVPIKEIDPSNLNQQALGFFGKKETADWASNEIDLFISRKIKIANLLPSPKATKEALLRRVSLDLIGLPAPASLAKQFLSNDHPISYEQLVDSLLASPRFGERWASMWLDLARYADSKGFERDASRSIWEYRDYIIRSFNQDLPYDQFLTEQIAGDLLTNPTDAQYIATGFHRNTTTNDEGGSDNEEYRVAAVIDRVNTTWQAVMGTTFSCVQCHGHPYDPFFHDDYYEFMAFFNNTRDNDTHKDYPWLRTFSTLNKEKLEELQSWVSKVESPERADEIRTFIKTWQPIIYSLESDTYVNADLYDTKYLGFRKNGSARLPNVSLTEKETVIFRALTTVPGGKFSIHLDSTNGPKIAELRLPNTNWKNRFFEIPIKKTSGQHPLFLQYKNPTLQSKDKNGFQIDWFYFTKNFPGKTDAAYQSKKQLFWDLMETESAHTLIMIPNATDRQRKTHIFDRGNWQSLTDEVQPNVPDIFEPLPKNAPKNRLGLAQWLTSKNNPLTARTMVNRLWEQLFGVGLSEILEDLGTQGIPPTHPELLDWLSWQFMNDYQWSVKKMLRLMVSSATYQQSAIANKESIDTDPYNKFYARGPRVRLSAEQIRDQALVVSGLYNPEMYGPPVMPYQPKGLWQTPYNSEKWEKSEDGNNYRRAIYTFMKRSTPYPSMETFDVSARQVCVSRRIRTNTPLQALVTLNDPVFIEIAQHLAMRMQKEGGNQLEQQIQKGYQLAIGKTINKEKQQIFEDLYSKAFHEFKNNKKESTLLIKDLIEVSDTSATAALIIVANAMTNLDEFLVK